MTFTYYDIIYFVFISFDTATTSNYQQQTEMESETPNTILHWPTMKNVSLVSECRYDMCYTKNCVSKFVYKYSKKKKIIIQTKLYKNKDYMKLSKT